MSGDRIHDQADHRAVDTIRFKVCTLCHRTGNNRCRCSAEYSLKNRITPCRKCTEVIRSSDQRVKSADQRTGSRKHNAEPDQPEARRSDTEIHHIFHQDITCIFCPRQPRLAKCKSGLHKKHQNCRYQYPDYICC